MGKGQGNHPKAHSRRECALFGPASPVLRAFPALTGNRPCLHLYCFSSHKLVDIASCGIGRRATTDRASRSAKRWRAQTLENSG